jgi:hypothetical protein
MVGRRRARKSPIIKSTNDFRGREAMRRGGNGASRRNRDRAGTR